MNIFDDPCPEKRAQAGTAPGAAALATGRRGLPSVGTSIFTATPSWRPPGSREDPLEGMCIIVSTVPQNSKYWMIWAPIYMGDLGKSARKIAGSMDVPLQKTHGSPSLLISGFWLAQVPENFPFFFTNILMPIPAKAIAIIPIVIKNIFILQNYIKKGLQKVALLSF